MLYCYSVLRPSLENIILYLSDTTISCFVLRYSADIILISIKHLQAILGNDFGDHWFVVSHILQNWI